MSKDIRQRLREYEQHYNLFFEQGRTLNPPHGGNGFPEYDAARQKSETDSVRHDPLKTFIENVIEDNPQLKGSDRTWNELFKERTMSFVDSMLHQFLPIEEHKQKEHAYIDKFEQCDEEEKEQMLPQVTNALHSYYTPLEVNIDGYLEQLEYSNRQAVFTAMIADWRKASAHRIQRLKESIINRNKQQWEINVREWGISDYKERKKIDSVFYQYPQLEEIVRMMGREQPNSQEIKDDYLMQYLPILPSTPQSAAEVEEILLGQSVKHLLPIEMAIMAQKSTENLFYKRYVSHQLQLFANRPKSESATKHTVKRKDKTRLEKGPMIVALDTSGSMYGQPLKIATTLLFKLLKMAQRQNRNCFLIMFSVRSKCIDLTTKNTWSQLKLFMQNHFTGGTDGEEMLGKAVDMLNSKSYEMADVLIISDFFFSLPKPATIEKILKERSKSTCFYGLQIGKGVCDYEQILDKVWKV